MKQPKTTPLLAAGDFWQFVKDQGSRFGEWINQDSSIKPRKGPLFRLLSKSAAHQGKSLRSEVCVAMPLVMEVWEAKRYLTSVLANLSAFLKHVPAKRFTVQVVLGENLYCDGMRIENKMGNKAVICVALK